MGRSMAEEPNPAPVVKGDVITRNPQTVGMIIGICIGVAASLVLATCFIVFKFRRRKHALVHQGSSDRKDVVLPIRMNGQNSSLILSDSDLGLGERSPVPQNVSSFLRANKELNFSAGILPFTYKELQKATKNFTSIVGRGAFGSVYKAVRHSGPVLAVKRLDMKSKQGGKEFQTEVLLLGRLHHRNLVNLVGYCAERGECMLVYEFMSGGSLAELLFNDKYKPLRWDLRVRIAQDVSRGVEYLHDGAVPPVVHRDLKSANILLDSSWTAKVSDFGLSKEASLGAPPSAVKGTFGYVDPEYVLTNAFTEKSDVYSFGVLLFELMAGRSPQQGLMDYVKLAAMGADGTSGWEELLDPRLDGQCNLEELGQIASIGLKCVHDKPSERPRMRDVSQWLLGIGNNDPMYNNTKRLPAVQELHCEETEISDSEYAETSP